MPPFFILLAIVLSSVVIVSLILAKFRQSLLVGYFFCGIALSKSGLLDKAGVGDGNLVQDLSETGVILLLFTLGIEFSIRELKSLKRAALLGGGLQVSLSILAAMFAGIFFIGLSLPHALALGFAISLSSTAVSLKSFQDLGQPESPQARVTLGIAIFQDLAAILFMVLIPALLSEEGSGTLSIGIALIKGACFTGAVILFSRYGLPQLLDAVARTRSRELFTVAVVGLCAAVAMFSGLLNLSPALGAFAAGLVVSESMYSHRVLSDILPFKDLFITVFFVSVGLLIDTDLLLEHWLTISLCSLMILVVKGSIVAFSARLSGLRRASWLVTAAALASTGEFSIVLLNRLSDFQVLTSLWEQILLASTAVTMALVPSLMKGSLHLSNKLKQSLSIAPSYCPESLTVLEEIEHIENHIIICGYGPVGRNLHQNLVKSNIPVIVLEMNPNTVKTLHAQGIHCLFADSQNLESLQLAHAERARGIAITFPDKDTALATAHIALEMNPKIRLYARSKFVEGIESLQSAGIHHILNDEEQSGRAMIRAVMLCYSADIEEQWES